jgi:hypothetical protein
MSFLLSAATAAMASLALEAHTPPEALCADQTWREVFTQEGVQCVPARAGVAFAPAERARFLAPLIDEAAGRYGARFSQPGRPAAVISGSMVTREQAEWLRKRGYGNLPGPGGSDMTPDKEKGVLAHELAHV